MKTALQHKTREVARLEKELDQLKQRLKRARKHRPWQEIQDYTFKDAQGQAVTLSEMFGDGDELMLVHNMGKDCPYCTLWGDGYNGLTQHLENRAAFVVVSPDAPKVMAAFAKQRGWKFKMFSSQGNSFKKDLGFGDNQRPQPGFSTFYKDNQGRLFHVASDSFGPGDNYCAAWHFFDLLPKGSGDWQPKFKY